MFGPLTSIIGKQIVEALRFLFLLALFILGFTMLGMALNTPYRIDKNSNYDEMSEPSINEELKRSKALKLFDCYGLYSEP